jgi:predicted transcriptional regulator
MAKRLGKPVPTSDPTVPILVALASATLSRLDAIARETSVPRVVLIRSAVETLVAQHREEKLSVELSEDLRRDLMILCDVMDGASVQVMMERSLRQRIDDTLAKNEGIRDAYKKLRARNEARAQVVQFPMALSRTE